jgi:penicillin G amidase
LNITYGDKQGNIAWWATAKLVKRPAHVNPALILNGSNGNDEPLGYFDFEDNPRSVNPTSGYVYSANDWPEAFKDRNDTDTTVQWYPGYYKPPFRADRIRTLLESRSDWDLNEMKSVMTDFVNKHDAQLMEEWRRELMSIPDISEAFFYQAYHELLNWDGSYTPESAQPTLFNKCMFHLMKEAMEDEFGEERFKLFLQTHQLQRTQYRLWFNSNSPWWDNKRTPDVVETRKDCLLKAFKRSIEDLREQFGANPKVWNWSKAAQLELKHPLGQVAVLKPVFNVGPKPIHGGSETIMQAGYKLNGTGVYDVFYGSQMRIIVDFATPDSSLNITPCGQSGHLMSKHYDDQYDRYTAMQFRTVRFNHGDRFLYLKPQ